MRDIVAVRHIKDYQLEVIFEDRASGLVDLKDYAARGGVFSRFSDMDYFRKVYVNKDLGTLCWPDDVDIAPETLYSLAMKKAL
ncbi:MAG: DUF2442 domain-containing protein [Elusimicrobia bacterium]|nr:DUF2442 domain-containing protein [Elusimicrobiota bacterium]